MRFLQRLLPIVLACGFTSSAFATSQDISERDMSTIADFIKSKRTITVEEKGGNLAISGSVHAEWQTLCEKEFGNHLRGSKGFNQADSKDGFVVPNPTNEYDVEVNLMFDYKCDRTWAHAHLEFDNNSGIPRRHDGSGLCDDICLFAAYIGYNICEMGCSRLDLEIGRRKLYHVFDSKVQFESNFDGLLLSYYNCFECLFDFYIRGSAFVVNEDIDHYAYAGEVGFIDIFAANVDLKYSFISWTHDGVSRHRTDAEGIVHSPRWEYAISQVTGAYRFCPEFLRSDVYIYGAWLYNHDAHTFDARLDPFTTVRGSENSAWYAGARFGKIRYEGDWSAEIRYEHVEALAIPDFDSSGIGRGNVKRENIVDHGRGNTNYRGWAIEAAYAVTDNLALTTEAEFSDEIEKNIGGKHDYAKFEVEFVYAW